MKIVIKEKLSAHKYKTPEGYLICTDAILSRTGKQEYRRGEVFGADCQDADSIVHIDRTEKEVFSDAALASFENKPITVEHPDEDVNINNYKEYAVGFVRDVRRGEYNGKPVMIGNLVITDAQTIEEIENGEHTDLSCGYDCDILDEDNPQQRNIRGNHVALCSQGRAGIAKIIDSMKDDKKAFELSQYTNDFETTHTKLSNGEEIIELSDRDERNSKLISALKSAGFKQVSSFRFVKDSYYTSAQKEDKEFVQNAIKEMNRYINNWSFMSSKEKQNIGCSLSELKARVKELQSVKDSQCDDSQFEYSFGEFEEFDLNEAKEIAKEYNVQVSKSSNGLLFKGSKTALIDLIDNEMTESSAKKLKSVIKDCIKDTRLEEGKTYTTKSGAKLTIKKLECGYNDYNGNANITIYYDYVSASGNKKGSSKCSANDFFNMMTDASMTGDSMKDEFKPGQYVNYEGIKVKILRKLTEEEKKNRSYAANPNAGNYYEVEASSNSLGKSTYIVWEGRLKDSIEDMLADIKEVDAKNYVVGQNGVWFAKPKGKKDMFDVAYASNDEGKTWHTCYKEKKSASSTTGSRTQAGKIIFRTSASFPGPRTSIGRNVLTWYANNGEHHQTPGYDIDHVDDNYLNDALSNLKKISHTENIQKMQAALKKKVAIGADSINDDGLKVYQVRNGYAIVLKRYWDKYKEKSFIERWEHSLDAARYTRWSLEIHDGLSFVIVDCTQAGKVKVVDSAKNEISNAIEKVKTARIPLGETFEYTQTHITVQVQHVGKDEYEDITKFKHVKPKTSSHAWGRVWVDGKMTLNTSDSLVVVMNNILKHLHSLKSSIHDALVDLTAKQLTEIEHAIQSLGFKIEKKGRTWSGAVHYQIITKQGGYSKKEELLEYVRKLDTLDDWIEKHYHAPMTFNIGLQHDGYISAGLDIREAYVKDSIPTYSKLSKIIKIVKKVKK